jgi:hypothetical protein
MYTLANFHPPSLSQWLQQLAGILPLSAVVEFIDVPTKLHLYQLNGAVALWNWPVTPAGAHHLLSHEDNSTACCLDHPSHSVILHCIDGRWGDCYPSSTPTTTRLCVSSIKDSQKIPNGCIKLASSSARRQTLDVLWIRSLDSITNKRTFFTFWPFRHFLGNSWSTWYSTVVIVGWIAWSIVTVMSILLSLYVATAYMLLMPLTGWMITITHGGNPRSLLDGQPSHNTRLILSTDSFNANKWWVFYGKSSILNSILNKPLYRNSKIPHYQVGLHLLRLMIGCQWVAAVGSCALQDWNALLIVFWISFCSLVSSYAYPPKKSVRDWLQHHCKLKIKKTSAEFSSRRSMLAAIVCLNPDTRENRTNWIDPILAKSEDRTEWEAATLRNLESGKFIDFIIAMPNLTARLFASK